MSLNARMEWALRLAVGLSLMLVLATLLTARKIDETSLSVRTVTSDLRAQDLREVQLRDLRAAIGTATRAAERGRDVGVAKIDLIMAATYRLAHSTEKLRDAQARHASIDFDALAQRRIVFARSARQLLQTARESPSEIPTRLPDYLKSLQSLEDAQIRVRHALTRDADAASLQNRDIFKLWQAGFTAGALVLIFIIAALTRWVRRDIMVPIRRLNGILKETSHQSTLEVDSARADEVGALATGVVALQRLLAGREEALARLEIISHTDALTGLPNRLLFEERLPDALAEATRSGGEVALICIDIDQFKEVNDAQGHGGGDRVLCQIANMLQANCDGDEIVSRIGGDEFAIIQTGAIQPAAARKLVDRLMAGMAAHRAAFDASTGISVGAAIYPRDGNSDQVLRHHADLALYRAKNSGRGRACFFGALEAATLDGPGTGTSSLAADLPAAIRNSELAVAYQPKLHVRTNSIASAEALARWNHPTRGQVQPDDFIRIAERTGQIRALTEWILTQAIADQAWLKARGQKIEIFVNISATLLGDPDFAETLLRIVEARTGVIGLEITETAIIDEPEAALAHLHRFVDAGLKIAIDDYGAGWSSLSYLKQLPAHELKIDRSFISDISRSHRDPLLVRSTIDLAHALGMEVTAEGVDTAAALALLKVMGCDIIQGFLISKPISLDALAAFLDDEARLAHLDRMPIGLATTPVIRTQ